VTSAFKRPGTPIRRRTKGLIGAVLFSIVPGFAQAIEVKTLPAPPGAEVWYVHDHALPMIAVSIALPAGSAYDPPDKPGLANFAAELLDEGAGNMNAMAFQTALSNRAIRLSVSTGQDYLIVSLVTLAGNAKDAFQLLGEALAHPRFDHDAVARVRAQVLADISEEDEDPEAVALSGFFRIFFHNTPYAHPVSGDQSSVAAISAQDLKRFVAAHWVSHGLKVSVAGDVDEATLTPLLATAFGGLSAAAPRAPSFVARQGPPGVSDIAMPVPQSTAVFGLPGLLRNSPDYLPAYVANYILGGGESASRLTDEIREKRGLTYDVSTSLESLRKSGFILGEAATQRGAMKATISTVRDTLRQFAQSGPTAPELADAKTYLIGSWPLSFSSDTGTADQLNTFERLGLSVDYVNNRNALINAVTLDQVKREAARLFNPAKLTVVVAGSIGESPAAGNAAATAELP
jgi:zinc protease